MPDLVYTSIILLCGNNTEFLFNMMKGQKCSFREESQSALVLEGIGLSIELSLLCHPLP